MGVSSGFSGPCDPECPKRVVPCPSWSVTDSATESHRLRTGWEVSVHLPPLGRDGGKGPPGTRGKGGDRSRRGGVWDGGEGPPGVRRKGGDRSRRVGVSSPIYPTDSAGSRLRTVSQEFGPLRRRDVGVRGCCLCREGDRVHSSGCPMTFSIVERVVFQCYINGGTTLVDSEVPDRPFISGVYFDGAFSTVSSVRVGPSVPTTWTRSSRRGVPRSPSRCAPTPTPTPGPEEAAETRSRFPTPHCVPVGTRSFFGRGRRYSGEGDAPARVVCYGSSRPSKGHRGSLWWGYEWSRRRPVSRERG